MSLKDIINEAFSIEDKLLIPEKLTRVQRRCLQKKMEDFHQELNNYNHYGAVQCLKEVSGMYNSFVNNGYKDLSYEKIIDAAIAYTERKYPEYWKV